MILCVSNLDVCPCECSLPHPCMTEFLPTREEAERESEGRHIVRTRSEKNIFFEKCQDLCKNEKNMNA